MIKWLTMVIIMVTTIYPSDWRWAKDTSEFTMDKQAHFAGSFGLYFMFRHKEFSESDSFKYSLYFGIAKEIIDAYVPYEEHGKWGGDGFSKYDLAYDLLGIGAAYCLDELWKTRKVDIKYSKNHLNFTWKID